VLIILTERNLKMKPTADNPDAHIRG